MSGIRERLTDWIAVPPVHPVLRPGAVVVSAFLRRGTLATMPRWMRQMADLAGPSMSDRALDAAVVVPLKVSFAVISRSTRLQLMLLKVLSPSTVEVAARALLHTPPAEPVITTPRAAQRRFGYADPSQAHQELRTRQRDRVLGRGDAPSDEGLLESQAILGTVG